MKQKRKGVGWLATMMVALFSAFVAMACGDMSDLELTDEAGNPAEFAEVEELKQGLMVCPSTEWRTITTVSGTAWDEGWVCDDSWACEYTYYSYATTFTLPVSLLDNAFPNHISKKVGKDHLQMLMGWNYGSVEVKAVYQKTTGEWVTSPKFSGGLVLAGYQDYPSGRFGYVSRAQFGIPDSAPISWSFRPLTSSAGHQVLKYLRESVCLR